MKRQEYELVPSGSLDVLQVSLRRMERRLQLTIAGWALTVLVLGMVGIVGLSVMRQALQQSDLRARSIHLIDASGRTRIDLAAGSNGPAVALYDTAGKSRLGLTVGPDGAQVVLAGPNEDERAVLHVSAAGIPDFVISDAAGAQAILTPSTVLLDKNKKVFWAAP